ncbi:MAG: hypothetical protein QOG04_2234 [Actinomycetota bacterium]|nr:hypothetical protein [Actinomycetota bacterium]
MPWPDGSWLTWNDETESWEKQEGPPPGDQPVPATASTPKAAAPTTAKPAKKPPVAKATSKPAREVPAAAKRAPERAPEPASDRPPVKIDIDTEGSTTQTSSAWRPMAARPERAVERIPTTPVARVAEQPRRPLNVSRSRDLSLLPVIGAGCLAGIAAGYLLHFLIR